MGGGSHLLISLSIAGALLGLASRADPVPARDHAADARLLEELGKTSEAAREYETAFAETHSPELLYRLALCRRSLGDYASAREALRGYLREAPDGPLRDEVERQLAQLAVLIEARGLRSTELTDKKAEAPARAKRRTATPPAADRSSGGAASIATRPAAPTPAAASRAAAAPDAAARDAPTAEAASSSATAPNATVAGSVATPSEIVSAQHEASAAARESAPTPSLTPAPMAAATPAAVPAPALAASNDSIGPAPALSVEPGTVPQRSRWHPSLPWIAGGAALLAAGGVALCVDAQGISSDLDARLATGELTAADQPRYSRAHAEGIAGTALIGLAAVALGALVVIAW